MVWSGRRQLAFCFPGLLASDATTAAPARTRRSPAADCHPLCTTGSSPSLAPTKRLQASNRIAPKSSETEERKFLFLCVRQPQYASLHFTDGETESQGPVSLLAGCPVRVSPRAMRANP